MEPTEQIEEVKTTPKEEIQKNQSPKDLFEKVDSKEEKEIKVVASESSERKKFCDLFERIGEEEKKDSEDAETPKKNKNKKEGKKEIVIEETKAEIQEVQNLLSNSVEDNIKKISALVSDCLYDDAYALAKELRESENFDMKALSQKDQNILIDVEETYKHIEEVCQYLNDEEGWYVDSSNSTVTTKYKKYPNSNSYTMKMEGELNFPIENMCSIVYEIEYFNEFVPFCSQSYSIRQISKGAKLCYFMLDIPFWSNREGYIRGFGVDRIKKNNTILIISKTIDEDKAMLQRLDFEIPPAEKCVRLKMDHFCFEVTPITRNKFKLRSLLNMEPKVPYVPQFVINFFARKIGSHMFSKLLRLAENMTDKKWEEIRKKEESKDYYQWLNTKIEEIEKRTREEKEKSEAPVRI